MPPDRRCGLLRTRATVARPASNPSRPMDPSPAVRVARAPWWRRLLLSFAVVGLTLALVVLTFLVLAGSLPVVYAALEEAASPDAKLPGYVRTTLVLVAVATVLLPAVLMLGASRRRVLTGRAVAAGWLAVAPVLVWLAWDEPAILHPLPVEEFSPAFPGAEESYRVLMEYSRRNPSEEARAFDRVRLQVRTIPSLARVPDYLAFVAQNRAALAADWETLAPQRAWLGRVTAFERIGDLTPGDFAADIPDFRAWRLLSQHVCAHAAGLALDGRRDEALLALVPLLEAGRKLQTSSRTLVRTMMGVTIERMAVDATGLVLDQGEASPAARARVRAALGTVSAPAMARRLVLIEYAQFAPRFGHLRLGELVLLGREGGAVARPLLNAFSSLAVNPNATINLFGRYVEELAGFAERRELGKLAAARETLHRNFRGEVRMKNLGGRLFVWLSTPAYDRIVGSHWKLADLREGLLRRLD